MRRLSLSLQTSQTRKQASVDALTAAWVDQREGLAEGGALATFNERLVRRWAIETGIIEKLYTIDRGTTELLVAHGLDSALIEHGATNLPAEELVTILKDHRDAAGFVTDYVAQGRGLTAHFIKSVHSLLCRNQDYTEGEDQFGNTIRAKLCKGEWKTIANNPKRPTGEIYEYCPPILVNDEIESLLNLYAEMTDAGVATVSVIAAELERYPRHPSLHRLQSQVARGSRAETDVALLILPWTSGTSPLTAANVSQSRELTRRLTGSVLRGNQHPDIGQPREALRRSYGGLVHDAENEVRRLKGIEA